MLPFQADLQGRQMEQVKRRIEKTGDITEEEAFSLLDDNVEELKKYLYYTSASYIKKIDLPRHEELKNIIFNQNKKLQLEEFARYLSKKENIRKLQEIFPIVATTCISAHKLGEPEPMFDMVIMDEASQCNLAVSLVPVIRGGSLMLVGDPQQLNPVIQLEELVNQKLRKKYNISEEYDYRKNSIYKTFLACDAVSDEILLHYHYRCHEKIIGFNNKKYYNEKLCIKTKSDEKEPLLYIDVKDSQSNGKNTAPAEVEEILRYAAANRDKTIGVITPFVNQRKLLEEAAREARLANVDCGTVHAFQGDEKDVVLFSTAITQQTGQGTYQWLKNNKELINVATSRARDKLVILADMKHLDWLHQQEKEDDFYELVQYTRQNGMSKVTQKKANSRALGVKPFSTETEEAFLKNLNHALYKTFAAVLMFSGKEIHQNLLDMIVPSGIGVFHPDHLQVKNIADFLLLPLPLPQKLLFQLLPSLQFNGQYRNFPVLLLFIHYEIKLMPGIFRKQFLCIHFLLHEKTVLRQPDIFQCMI